MRRTNFAPRHSVRVALTAALLTFPLGLVTAGVASRSVLIVLVYSGCQFWGLGDNTVIGVFAAAAIIAAYTLARYVYRTQRWQAVASAEGQWRYCHTCGYDLTGNTSGVCPECGTETVD